MNLLRPEALATLARWREVLAAVAVAATALWLFRLGGYILAPLGVALGLAALGWAVIALRRMRFSRAVAAPGLVEVDEGQIGYFGAGLGIGGYVALRDLTEIRLLSLRGALYWRLKQTDGQAILIPVAAAGAGALYDAFATLPGIDMGRLTAALDQHHPAQSLWQRPAASALT